MKKSFAKYFDKITVDGGSPAGGSPSGKVDDKQAPPESTLAFEEGGPELETDDFGYPIEKPVEGTPNPQATKTPAKEPEQKTDDSKTSTGYEEDIVIPAEVPPVVPPEKPASVQEKLGFELEFGDMDKPTAEKVADFAKANGLTKEAAQAFVNLKNSESASLKADQLARQTAFEKEVVKLKSDWQKELKADADFGGEKYPQSVKNVDKVLTDFLPNTKKALTEGNRMLPPMVMKDLAKLHATLYAPEKIVQGDPPGKADESSDDPLDFYV